MRTLLILLLATTLIYKANAQRFANEYGKVSKADIELKSYKKDPAAEAVVIYDKGWSRFVQNGSGFDLIFEHTKRIKIFSDAGIKYAEIEIPFYREGNIFERIYDLEACTYNYEGAQLTRTFITKDSWNDEKLNEYWMIRKFAMPNVKAGSIIEFKYKISSQYLFNLRDWEFQDRIPTIYSEYRADMIPFYEYIYLTQETGSSLLKNNYVDIASSSEFAGIEYKNMVNKFVMTDIPAFKSEDFITSINDYITKIDFQLAKVNYPNGQVQNIMGTWPVLIKEYLDHNDFGKYLKKCEKIAPKLLDLKSLENNTPDEKFDFILNYVKANYNWNEYNGRYASKTVNNVIKDKFGNAADLNLFTIGLLRAVGIEAYPVLISTRNHGKVYPQYTFNHYFNYVVIFAQINEKKVLSDATDINVANNRIPSRCINEKGLLIKKGEKEEKEKWIGLQSRFPSVTSSDFLINCAEEELEIKVKHYASEYKAFRLKNKIGNDEEKLKEYLEENGYNVNNVSFPELTEDKQRKEFQFEFDLQTQAENINNKLYISPFLKEALLDNPLNQDTRTYPVDMTYPTKKILTSTINIPEGYTIDYQPEDSKIKNDHFELLYTISKSENELKIMFLTEFKNSVYPAKDYKKVKYYFNQIVKKGNEKVVLKKVSNP